jgi:proline dehydrogenase
MSISSVSSSNAWDLSSQKTSATTTWSSTKQAATDKAAASASPEDTVKISAAAQAKLMEKQGMTIKQIATSLATDTKTVDQYLGVTSASSGETESLLNMLP